MRHFVVLCSTILAVACQSADKTAPIAVVEIINHGIIAGNAQIQPAGPATFHAAVVEQIAKETRPSLLSAQTGVVVKGSPVVGAVVCVSEASPLVPFARCTNTDAEGKAFFFLKAPTAAGDYVAEIVGTLNRLPAVFDTARMTVLAGTPDSNAIFDLVGERSSPAVFAPAHVIDMFTNPVPYRIPSDARLTAQDTVLGSLGARTVTFAAESADSVWRTLIVTGATGSLVQFTYRLVVRQSGAPGIQAVFCGLRVTPCKSTLWVP